MERLFGPSWQDGNGGEMMFFGNTYFWIDGVFVIYVHFELFLSKLLITYDDGQSYIELIGFN